MMNAKILKMQSVCGSLRRISDLEEFQDNIKRWNLKKLKSKYAELEQSVSDWTALGGGSNDDFLSEIHQEMDIIRLEIKRR